jgi:dUTP pyrophosphatase
MKVFRDKESASIPEFATEGSACFDLRACLDEGDRVTAFNPHNKEMQIPVKTVGGKRSIQLHPAFRTLIPTGLIFDIPKNHEMKIYIRSSMALKYGLMLANGVAVIDSDYVDPTYIMVFNASDTPITIFHDDRIAQAQLIQLKDTALTERKSRPERKTDRDGGLGSTGTN